MRHLLRRRQGGPELRRCGRLLMAVLVFFALGGSGCRQAPATEPERYAREVKPTVEPRLGDERPLPDVYPWQRRAMRIEDQGERIQKTEQRFQEEIRYHDTVVHGAAWVKRNERRW